MWYPIFLVITFLELLWEIRVSMRNSRILKEKGATEIAPILLPIFGLIYLFLYVGSFVEYSVAQRFISLMWALVFGIVFLLAKGLKWWAVKSLGPFWTMRVLILRESNVVTRGPYRFIRHPNYIAVLMEVAAIPLTGKNYFTVSISMIACAITLYFRIKREEEALMNLTDYSSKMESKKRFSPL
jgi:methyltransferase